MVATSLNQVRNQTRFNLLAFRRNPAATFFTVILPLIFLFVFTTIFGNEVVSGDRRAATFYVPSILALAIISATLANLAMTLTTRREQGVLKRVRSTPIKPWVFVVAQGLAGFVLSLIMTVLFIVIGWLVFNVTVQAVGVVPLVISVFIGAASFSAMGVALTVIIPSEEAAPAVTNALLLPLYFISDIFIIGDDGEPAIGGVVGFIANVFPVKHFGAALTESFDPFATDMPLPVGHWLVVLAWGAFALVVALWKFRWVPRR